MSCSLQSLGYLKDILVVALSCIVKVPMKLAVTSCVSIILILAAEEVRSVEEPVPHTTWKRRRSRLSDIKGIQTRGGGSTIDDGPYSFSLTTFSPRGSLNQLEYAMNAASVRNGRLVTHTS